MVSNPHSNEEAARPADPESIPISPFRSLTLFGYFLTAILVTVLSSGILESYKSPFILFWIFAVQIGLGTFITDIYMLTEDKTQECDAMIGFLVWGFVSGIVFFIIKIIIMQDGEILSVWRFAAWILFLNRLAAIGFGRGFRALWQEVLSLPSNIWIFLYGYVGDKPPA